MADVTPARTQRRCSRCKKNRRIEQFGISRSSKDGLNPWCKPCKSKARRREYLRVKHERRVGVQLALDLDIKVCPHCKTAKMTDAFGQSKDRRDGLAPYCKACSSQLSAAMYAQNPERFTARTVRWRKANRRAVSDIVHRRWARQRDATLVPFTQDQLLAKWSYWGGRCWICGTTATATDHVKPLSKGGAHILCNLRPICRSCNSRKNGRWPFDLQALRSAASTQTCQAGAGVPERA